MFIGEIVLCSGDRFEECNGYNKVFDIVQEFKKKNPITSCTGGRKNISFTIGKNITLKFDLDSADPCVLLNVCGYDIEKFNKTYEELFKVIGVIFNRQ